MKILQTILNDTNLFVFTETPTQDIEYFIEKYNNWDSKIHLWYDIPNLNVFNFLWNDYNCIHLWYDNEIDMAYDCKLSFDKLIT